MDLRLAVECMTLMITGLGAALCGDRLRRARRRDRAIIDVLGRTVDGPRSRLAGITIGSALHSASPGVQLGGDIVDVFDLDGRFVMICVADVSGKGVEAAARTAFVKYSIRTLALENEGDPAVVLAKFNTMYARTVDDRESFVTLILGVIDTQTGELRYANAGHEPAFVRHAGAVTLLAPTGPIVGVTEFCAYRTQSLYLAPSDTLVWATDGLTEARDARNTLLGAAGLAGWIAGGPADPQAMAATLFASLRRRSGPPHDDVAVLAIACDAVAAPRMGVLATLPA